MKQRTFRVNLIENPFMIGWREVDMVSSPPSGNPVYWKCTHPAPFYFKLPSGTWIKKCGTCCAVLGSFAKEDSPEELIRTEAILKRPEPSWISKRLFVKRVLPDASMVRGLFGKLAVTSNTFSSQVGGGSLTGWQENDTIQSIWERAYRNLTTGTFNSLYLRNRITKAREEMDKREEGRGRTAPLTGRAYRDRVREAMSFSQPKRIEYD